MKCPCCEIEIVDERFQVYHVERCHPELLRSRWSEGGMHEGEIRARLAEIAHRSPLGTLIADCNRKGWQVVVMATPGKRAQVILVPCDEPTVVGEGETPIAALCLAIDRLEYGE